MADDGKKRTQLPDATKMAVVGELVGHACHVKVTAGIMRAVAGKYEVHINTVASLWQRATTARSEGVRSCYLS